MKQYDEKIKQKHAAGEPQMLALDEALAGGWRGFHCFYPRD
jgi:hypothetical protein